MLYEKNFLNPNSSDVSDVSNEFWYCFQRSLDENKRGYDGKRRILSIIADQFTYDELQKNLNVCVSKINTSCTNKFYLFKSKKFFKITLFTNLCF